MLDGRKPKVGLWVAGQGAGTVERAKAKADRMIHDAALRRSLRCHVVVVPRSGEILPDPKFGDQVLSKFMNNLMYRW